MADWLREQERPARYLASARFVSIAQRIRSLLSQLSMIRGSDPDSATDIANLRSFEADGARFRSAVNARFMADEAARCRDFFDTIEAKPLTPEQREAVLVDEDRNLIVAAAGSGKTSVIVAKVAHLAQQGFIQPAEILVMAFNRSAREELEQRIAMRIAARGRDVAVHTFNALGLKILGDVEGRRPTVAKVANDPLALHRLLQDIVERLSSGDDIFAMKFKAWFTSFATRYRSIFEFETLGEYYAYIKSHEARSLEGELLKSLEECEIANWLYCSGIVYEYEKEYNIPDRGTDPRRYHPDFYLPDHDIWIEHFALDEKGRTPPFIDQEKYATEREWKIKLHRSNHTTLVQTFSHEKRSGTLLTLLQQKLAAHGVMARPTDMAEILARLNEKGRLNTFIGLLATFLSHYKGSWAAPEPLRQRASESKDPARNAAFLDVFLPVFERYQETLADCGEIDFDDMILRATEHVSAGRWTAPFSYICVDEFQDLSPARSAFLLALLRQRPTNQLLAVGDDWQSIYRFAGSDSGVMRMFSQQYSPSERRDLTTTFRCSAHIAEVSSRFVSANPLQIRKAVRAVRPSAGPDVHILLHPTPERDPEGKRGTQADTRLDLVIKTIRAWVADAGASAPSVLLLGRYNNTKPDMGNLHKALPQASINFMTVHASKGMEADLVFVLDVNEGRSGFPSETEDDPIIDLVLASPDPFPEAEERRLFYVALTRARHAVFVLARADRPSAFVKELANTNHLDIRGAITAGAVTGCPTCKGGTLQRRAGPKKSFLGCSNFPLCTHTQPACDACGEGCMRRKDNGYTCSSCGSSADVCQTCHSGWLVRRQGPSSSFWGCCRYPSCRGTARALENGNTSPALR